MAEKIEREQVTDDLWADIIDGRNPTVKVFIGWHNEEKYAIEVSEDGQIQNAWKLEDGDYVYADTANFHDG